MKYTWSAKDETGQDVTLRLDSLTSNVEVVQPEPEPGSIDLTKVKAVVAANDEVHYVRGVNVPRLADELILYTDMNVYAEVNRWGVDVVIGPDGFVQTISDRERTGDLPLPVAPGYLVLSGHREAAEWLRSNVHLKDVLGFRESYEAAPAAPAPPSPELELAGRANNCSMWVMMWPNSPAVDIANLPLEVDELRLAFAINDGRLVGYGPYGGREKLASLLSIFLSQRPGYGRISWSVGGGGYTITIPDPQTYVNNLLQIERDLGVPFKGLNWDWEASSFAPNAAKCIEVSRILKRLRPDFYVSWSPNGTFKNDYRNALKGSLDVVDEIAQQFYDSEVSFKQAMDEIATYVWMFGSSRVGVGMMVGSAAIYWDLSECKAYMDGLRKGYGVRKVNLWEGSRPYSKEWAVAMKAITA